MAWMWRQRTGVSIDADEVERCAGALEIEAQANPDDGEFLFGAASALRVLLEFEGGDRRDFAGYLSLLHEELREKGRV